MQTAQRPSAGTDVYTIVTNQVIGQLESGIIPWHASFKDAGIPRNVVSGLPYSGINIWLLATLNYAQNYFLTWKQIRTLGATVKRGEQGHLVVYFEQGKAGPVLRYDRLFNVAQCERIPASRIPVLDWSVHAAKRCREIVDAMPNPPAIESIGATFSYNPNADRITMPTHEFFADEAMYYGVLFYGLTQCTGHASRLNRRECLERKPLGPKLYTQEELLTEMAASYLCSFAGIAQVQVNHHTDDIACWLERLYADDRLIMSASMEAQRTINYILHHSVCCDFKTGTELPELL